MEAGTEVEFDSLVSLFDSAADEDPNCSMGPLLTYGLLIAGCVAAPFRPFYGFVVYVVFVTLCPQWLWRFSLHDESFPFQKFVAGATLLGFVLSGLKVQPLSRSARAAIWCGLLFLGLCAASAMQSIAPDPTWFFMDKIWKIFLMLYLGVHLVDTPAKAAIVLWSILLSVGFNACEINLDYLAKGYSEINLPGNEWGGLNANAYALLLLLTGMCAYAVAVLSRRFLVSLLGIVIALLCIHAVYVVESRGAMVGFLVGSCVMFFVRPKTMLSPYTLALGLGAILLAGPPVVKEFISIAAENRDVSAESRYYLWEAGIRICRDYPLLGVGPWAGEWLMPSYYNYGLDRVGVTKALHNLLLEIATGMGVPATLLYLTMYYLPLFELRAALKADPAQLQGNEPIALGCLAAIPAYWAASMFNSGALLELPYLVLALGTAVGVQWRIAHHHAPATITLPSQAPGAAVASHGPDPVVALSAWIGRS